MQLLKKYMYLINKCILCTHLHLLGPWLIFSIVTIIIDGIGASS